jgi:lipoprotein-releasing system permease protein
MSIFMVQGSLIGLIGTSLGLLGGFILCLFVPELFVWVEQMFGIQFLKSDVYPISYLPVDLRVSDMVLVGLTALVMSFFATLYPAWRASRVMPAQALRYE